MQSAFSAGDPQWALTEEVVAGIERASGGRLLIDLELAGAIVPAAEEFDGLRTGALDMAYSCNLYNKHLNSAAPLFGQVSGGLTTVQRMYWMEFGGGQELAIEMYKPHGMTYLTYIGLPAEDFAYTGFLLETLDDVKKMKMRTAGDGGEIMQMIGASTVFMPGGELYESMQRGVINSFEYGAAKEGYEMSFYEVFDYAYLSPCRAPSDENSIAARTESFEALPDDLKTVVEYVTAEAMNDYLGPCIEGDAVAMQKIIDYGCEYLPLPKVIEDAYLAAAEEFYNKNAQTEDEFYGRVIESQRKFKTYCDLKGVTGG
jgi:TRAP-type mannitol/chloroaromatic compound transport system substrate-binding protein